jgi:DNA-binding YbaB/EbfC family protein
MQGKNLQKLMREAQQMQEQLENEMGELRVEASSGGGMVSVTMDGTKRLVSVTINPEAVDQADVDMLQDLVLAAVNEAAREVDEALKDRLGGFAQGLLGPR